MRKPLRLLLGAMVVLVVVFLVAGVYLLGRFRTYTQMSTSMEPTVRKDERVLADCHSFAPNRGQAVVYQTEDGLLLIKRIAALGGDELELRDQQLFVNGERVIEPYAVHRGDPSLAAEMPFMANLSPTKIPPGELFVLGDNRDVSFESRHPNHGLIKETSIRCELLLILTSHDSTRNGMEIR